MINIVNFDFYDLYKNLGKTFYKNIFPEPFQKFLIFIITLQTYLLTKQT